MIVTIKFIAGQEFDLEVESSFTISSIKELVSRQFHVPVDQQRLVFKGKILADARCLCDYDIVAGTKLHLTVKKPEVRNYAAEDDKARNKLIGELKTALKPHYPPADVEKILEQLSQDLDRQVANSSLDDVERFLAPRVGGQSGASCTTSSTTGAAVAEVLSTKADMGAAEGPSKAGLAPIKNAKKS